MDGKTRTHAQARTHADTHRCVYLTQCRQYVELLCFCMITRTRYYVAACMAWSGICICDLFLLGHFDPLLLVT